MNNLTGYKSSYYNFLIEVDKNRLLLYNSLRNCLFSVEDPMEKRYLNLLIKNKTIDANLEVHQDFLTKLIDSGIIVDKNADEKNIIKNRIEKIKAGLISKHKSLFLTICPTNSCNMACPYCFEENKPKNGKMTDDTIRRILDYTKDVLNKHRSIEEINITWYGGEPLLAQEIIKKLSQEFIKLSEKGRLKYRADIITNGVLLNSKNWQLLEDCKIQSAQVTLDGSFETHNKSRPLTGLNKDSYHLILHNLATIPKEFNLRIRVNLDKEVEKGLDELLKDLDNNKIWPQKADNINISLARTENFSNHSFDGDDKLLSQEEFFKIKTSFLEKRLSYFNSWAKKSGKKIAKYAFHYPEASNLTCAEVALPVSFVIDSVGDMYKCWGYVNNKNRVIQSIFDDFSLLENKNEVNTAKNFNKFYYDRECQDCKFLPICDVDCMMKHTEESLNKTCCEWKYTLKDKLKKQYLLLINQPEKIQSLDIFKEINKNENCDC